MQYWVGINMSAVIYSSLAGQQHNEEHGWTFAAFLQYISKARKLCGHCKDPPNTPKWLYKVLTQKVCLIIYFTKKIETMYYYPYI